MVRVEDLRRMSDEVGEEEQRKRHDYQGRGQARDHDGGASECRLIYRFAKR
jgi:hypothetical protein